MAAVKRYKIELLSTAEGVNIRSKKLQRTESTVTVIIPAGCCKDNDVNETAKKLAQALSWGCHVGVIEFVVKSVKRYRKPATL